MAFNLNKNESTDNSTKKGFDLSKNTQETSTQPKRPSYWPYLIAGLLVIGAATWYLNMGNSATDLPPNDSTAASAMANTDTLTAKNESANKPVANTASDDQAAQEPTLVAQTSANEIPAAVNQTPIIAASFLAGSSKPKGLSNAILEMMRKKQTSDNALQISVLGYASSEGDPAVNQSISQGRADAYKQFLIQNGFAEHTITATGKGTENPIASNETEAGRRKNRRVEVSFNQQ